MDLSAQIRGFMERTERPVQWWASFLGIVTAAVTFLSGIYLVGHRRGVESAALVADAIPAPAAGKEQNQPSWVQSPPLNKSPYNQLHNLPLALAAADEGSVPARSDDGQLLIETATACLKKLSARSIEISFGGTMQDEETGAVTADSMIYTVRGPLGEALASGIELAPEDSEYGPR